MKPATLNLACSSGVPSPSSNPTRKKGVRPWARGVPQNLGLSFNITATAEASDFKFGTQLEFAKARHKIIPRGKSGHELGLRKLPYI